VVASIPKFSDIKFNSSTFDLGQFGKDFTRALSNTKDAINGKLEYVFGKGTNQVFNETCGDNRTVIVTITNLKKTPATVNALEARMLAAEGLTANKIGMTFSSTADPNSGITVMVSMFVMVMATLAFLI
jgi:hypothetical protein